MNNKQRLGLKGLMLGMPNVPGGVRMHGSELYRRVGALLVHTFRGVPHAAAAS
ncbi:MAG: hypothetical protein QOD56_1746, partial [Gammaproteobacteria bacterium]|nr:hypothetical protein [Gammaproteobacteria bacterium]